jgi:hypothetical protein
MYPEHIRRFTGKTFILNSFLISFPTVSFPEYLFFITVGLEKIQMYHLVFRVSSKVFPITLKLLIIIADTAINGVSTPLTASGILNPL